MDRYFACLGFISLLVLGALAKETVEVTRDITVKPTPNPLVDPQDKVDVVLNCTGSRSDLSYYIKNRIKWTFEKNDGTSEQYSLGFYLEMANRSRFALQYDEVAPGTGKGGYFTALTISGVNRADDGIYRCSLISEGGELIDSKELRLTVVNPVETVAIEIHDAKHNVIAQSNSPITTNSPEVKITPGKYMVKCDASGSNPEPVMNLFLNEEKPYVTLVTMEDKAAEFKSYKGSFEVKSLTINAHNTAQALVCTASIPGGYYESAEAGINLVVRIDKPTIVCQNATAAMGDKRSKIICKVTAEGNNAALMCDNVSWLLGNIGQTIQSDGRWKDETKMKSKNYDIIDSMCKKSEAGLLVVLELFTVGDIHFKETYFLVYGKGANAHRHPVMLYDVTVAAAGIATPLSLLACLILAIISKHLAHL